MLTMFASELKSWVENHPSKTNPQACLFPSPQSINLPIGDYAVFNVLAITGEKLGIKKRINPDWFRHSGLSCFVNDLNYNKQLLMWRAGETVRSLRSKQTKKE